MENTTDRSCQYLKLERERGREREIGWKEGRQTRRQTASERERQTERERLRHGDRERQGERDRDR